MENTEGMTNQEGMNFLERIMLITDIIVLACNTSFTELEQEKNLPAGAIVRQALRLSFTFAVRNCLEFKRNSINPQPKIAYTPLAEIAHEVKLLANRDPVEILLDLQLHSAASSSNPGDASYIGAKQFSECLLQSVDILRLKALLYRDVVRNDRNKNKPFVIAEDAKQSQYIALSIVYFISVLMVSRYRDIIEANSITANSTTNITSTPVAGKDSVQGKRNFQSLADSASINTNGKILNL